MNTSGEREYFPNGENGEGLDSSLVFFSIILYDALLGIFAAIAFSFGDIRTAIVLAASGLMAFLGLTLQMIVGLKPYLRLFYGLSGVVVFFYIVARGGSDPSGLFGNLGLIFGFAVVLGWRMASGFLLAMALALVGLFYWNLYFPFGTPFTLVVELKFMVAFIGLAVLALGYGYTIETRIEGLEGYSRKMADLAYKDEMTNLPNRRSTEDMLNQRWEEYKRTGQRFAVLLCNVDNFKALNTAFGRGFGDGVILRLANVLVQGLRSQDIVARWGGDEFLIILPGQSGPNALKVADRLRSRVESIQLIMRGKAVSVTISLGMASVENSLGPSDLLGTAEAGLYQAKNSGRNRVMVG